MPTTATAAGLSIQSPVLAPEKAAEVIDRLTRHHSVKEADG